MSVVMRAVTVLAGVFFAISAPASARIVKCGEVIKADTRVDNDLRCPTPVALKIGAHGVDVDLHGHTIEAIEYHDEGVVRDNGTALQNLGYDDVSIANGTLISPQLLGQGLTATDADRLTLRSLVVRGYGSVAVKGDRARIFDVATRGFGSTIRSDGATISRLTSETELDVFGQKVRVTNSELRSLTVFHLDDSVLQRNDVTWGLRVIGNRNAVRHNRGSGHWSLMDGGGNSVRGNRITRGSLSLAPGFSGSLVRDNTVSGAGPGSDVGGIRVAAGAMNNVLLSNTASGSADDGISVDEPTTTLTANRAFGNADFGIKAVAGVVDGGGNRAWGNGNPLQCLNVQC